MCDVCRWRLLEAGRQYVPPSKAVLNVLSNPGKPSGLRGDMRSLSESDVTISVCCICTRILLCMDNISTWTGLPVEESLRVTGKRDKWRRYVHGVANPLIEDS